MKPVPHVSTITFSKPEVDKRKSSQIVKPVPGPCSYDLHDPGMVIPTFNAKPPGKETFKVKRPQPIHPAHSKGKKNANEEDEQDEVKKKPEILHRLDQLIYGENYVNGQIVSTNDPSKPAVKKSSTKERNTLQRNVRNMLSRLNEPKPPITFDTKAKD